MVLLAETVDSDTWNYLNGTEVIYGRKKIMLLALNHL